MMFAVCKALIQGATVSKRAENNCLVLPGQEKRAFHAVMASEMSFCMQTIQHKDTSSTCGVLPVDQCRQKQKGEKKVFCKQKQQLMYI